MRHRIHAARRRAFAATLLLLTWAISSAWVGSRAETAAPPEPRAAGGRSFLTCAHGLGLVVAGMWLRDSRTMVEGMMLADRGCL